MQVSRCDGENGTLSLLEHLDVLHILMRQAFDKLIHLKMID